MSEVIVYGAGGDFANYVAPEGWPLIALAPYRKATLRLQSASIALEQK